MSLAKFENDLVKKGLEPTIRRYYSFYEGAVYDNKDPEYLGRVKLVCPAVYGDAVFNDWVYSKGSFGGKDKGLYAIPDKGDPIWVEFQTGDPSYPVWTYGHTDTKSKIASGKDILILQYDKCKLTFDRKAKTVTTETDKGKTVLSDKDFIVSLGGADQLTVTKLGIELMGSQNSAVLGESLLELLAYLMTLLAGLNVAGAPVMDATTVPIVSSPIYLQMKTLIASGTLLSKFVKLK